MKYSVYPVYSVVYEVMHWLTLYWSFHLCCYRVSVVADDFTPPTSLKPVQDIDMPTEEEYEFSFFDYHGYYPTFVDATSQCQG